MVDGIKRIFGDNLSQVVLLGSAIRDDFNPESSDVDIAVLLDQPAETHYRDLGRLGNDIEDDFDIHAQFSVRPKAEIDRLKSFELCWEGKVARGLVLFDSGKNDITQTLERDLAKAEVTARYLDQAAHWNANGFRYFRDDEIRESSYEWFSLLAEWEACRSVCRALQAVLLQADIDPAPKTIRWHVGSLFELAASANPEMEAARPLVSKLHQTLASYERDDIRDVEDMVKRSQRYIKLALERSKRVIEACRRVLA